MLRRMPLRRGSRKSRRQARRCVYAGEGATIHRCRRSLVRFADYCITHLKMLIDAAARRRCFERDHDLCRRCGTSENLQWSHWPSRSYIGTRWAFEGSCVHCAACHRYFTDRPLEHEAWMVAEFGEDTVTELKRLALEFASGRAKMDLEATARAFGVVA